MAIAFDAQSASAFSGAATTVTWAHTCTGSNRLLVVGMFAVGDILTGVTYAGSAMTFINKLAMTGGAAGQWIYLYYILNPTTGANNIVGTASSTAGMYGTGSSYTGVKQSSQPDASATQATATSQTSLTTSLTTVANNCWIVGHVYCNNAATAGTNTVMRTGSIVGLRNFDTNSDQTPAGSKSVQTTQTPTDFIGHVIASFSPSVTATPSASTFMLMGV